MFFFHSASLLAPICLQLQKDFPHQVAQLLLESGASPNATDADGQTALFTLVAKPAFDTTSETLCKLLLRHQADPDSRDGYGRTPLIQAAMFGSSVASKLLLAAGACCECVDAYGQSAASIATLRGDVDMLASLMCAAANGSKLPSSGFKSPGLCAVCLSEAKRGQCARCRRVSYCCRDHQVSHWKDKISSHKVACALFQKLATKMAQIRDSEGLIENIEKGKRAARMLITSLSL